MVCPLIFFLLVVWQLPCAHLSAFFPSFWRWILLFFCFVASFLSESRHPATSFSCRCAIFPATSCERNNNKEQKNRDPPPPNWELMIYSLNERTRTCVLYVCVCVLSWLVKNKREKQKFLKEQTCRGKKGKSDSGTHTQNRRRPGIINARKLIQWRAKTPPEKGWWLPRQKKKKQFLTFVIIFGREFRKKWGWHCATVNLGVAK